VLLPCHGPLSEALKETQGVEVFIAGVAVLRRKNLSVRGFIRYMKELFASYRYIKMLIKTHAIDVVYTNTGVVFPGAIAARHSGIKSVWHVREIFLHRMENLLISAVMDRYADIIIANSQATARAIRVDQGKVRVVYNAIEHGSSLVLPQGRRSAHPTVGMAGRINRWKGQKLFVDAAVLVHNRCPEAVFQIAGDAYVGEEHLATDLQAYIHAKGLDDHIRLLGRVEDMEAFYADLDVFVLPSIQPEPFGLVAIEAMERGVPVVATNHGGPTEIIEDGVDGFLVDADSPERMAERIIALLSDASLRERIGQAGRRKRRERFSIETMLVGIQGTLNELF
jgi:glycosyltransferase involved in cell wall biosynthesis